MPLEKPSFIYGRLGYLVLLRHVIRSIPIYYFMLLDLTQDGFKTLKKCAKSFCGDWDQKETLEFL